MRGCNTGLCAPLLLAGMLCCGCVRADGPRLGVEYELERDRKTGIRNHAVTLEPGWDFAEHSPVSRVSLLIERNEDARAEGDAGRERETKLFLRLRHGGRLAGTARYYVRGGVGRSFGSGDDFSYGYIEPGIELDMASRWEWSFGFRRIDAIDGTDGKRVRKYITGPTLALDRRNKLELRYRRGLGDSDVWSWSLAYVHRFQRCTPGGRARPRCVGAQGRKHARPVTLSGPDSVPLKVAASRAIWRASGRALHRMRAVRRGVTPQGDRRYW